jgi:hypothetical protein
MTPLRFTNPFNAPLAIITARIDLFHKVSLKHLVQGGEINPMFCEFVLRLRLSHSKRIDRRARCHAVASNSSRPISMRRTSEVPAPIVA